MKSVFLTLCLLFSCTKRESTSSEAEDFTKPFPLEDAAIHPSRCSYEDCVCTVSIPKYKPLYKNITNKEYESAFFPESGFDLSPAEAQKIKSFMSDKMNSDTILVVGYTDGCGDYDFNKALSKKRASKTARYVRSLGFRKKIITAGMSEITSTHSDNAKRVDIITSDNFSIKVPPPNLVADHYLLDASGSIQNYNAWVNIISANKKPTSRLHLSYTPKCANGTSAARITPAGPTEIWYSYWQVLDKMSPGQTLLILSDFDSRISLSPNESRRLREKVKKKGVRVYAINI